MIKAHFKLTQLYGEKVSKKKKRFSTKFKPKVSCAAAPAETKEKVQVAIWLFADFCSEKLCCIVTTIYNYTHIYAEI